MTERHDPQLERQFNDLLADALPPAGASDDLLMCECVCDSGDFRHADRRCHRRAFFHVALHLWGCCDEPDALAPNNVDPDGNLCVLMCGPCQRHAIQVAAARVRHLLANNVQCCPTCQRPSTTTGDLCETRPL